MLLKKLLIIGAGGVGKEIAYLVEDINKHSPEWQVLGFLDDDPALSGRLINGYRVLGSTALLDAVDEETYAVIAVGDPLARKAVALRLESARVRFATLVHPSVKRPDGFAPGEGSMVCAGTIISVNTVVGRHVYLNFRTIVAHDAVIKDFASVMNNCVLSGNVIVGECAFLGASVTTLQGIHIGDRAILGAGAVAISDIPADCTAVGVPARPVKVRGTDRS